jgi:hypothetical protein
MALASTQSSTDAASYNDLSQATATLRISVNFINQHVRVARWFIFKPKIPIWVNFGRALDWKNGYTLWPFGIFYGHLGFL